MTSQCWSKRRAGEEPAWVGETIDGGWLVLSSDFLTSASLDEPRRSPCRCWVHSAWRYFCHAVKPIAAEHNWKILWQTDSRVS